MENCLDLLKVKSSKEDATKYIKRCNKNFDNEQTFFWLVTQSSSRILERLRDTKQDCVTRKKDCLTRKKDCVTRKKDCGKKERLHDKPKEHPCMRLRT